jgi:hypothetical protein
MRIENHPIIENYEKGRKVAFWFDGRKLYGYEDEPIAMALKASKCIIIHIREMSRVAYFAPSEDAQTV